jgi:hypothetical protein
VDLAEKKIPMLLLLTINLKTKTYYSRCFIRQRPQLG